jgi:glycosyltransferase involved in cell wall biosynthesis
MGFDIVLIRSDSISNDVRVQKIIRSLSKRYSVLVLGWDREMMHESSETMENRVNVRRFRVRAPYGRINLILFYPLFWVWVFCNLLVYRPKIIHACDFDTFIPGYFSRLLFSNKVVFDSFDRYAMAFIPPKHHLIYTFVNTLEGLMAYKADALVTVSRERLSTFGDQSPNYSEVVMNCPEDVLDMTRGDTRMSSDYGLTLVHAGGIGRTLGLFLLDEAIKNLDDVRLVLAGRTDDKGMMEQLLRNPKIRYVGLLEHSEALKLEGTADIMPIFYDPALPISHVANPNKLFEAMMLGVPVITNVCKDIMNEVGCGLVVEYNANEVRKAILDLKRNVALRRNMGTRGRLAFEKMYNWAIMEKRLLGLYDKLQPVLK